MLDLFTESADIRICISLKRLSPLVVIFIQYASKTCRLFFLLDHMKQFALVTFQKRATVVGLGPSNSSHRAYSPECEPKHYHVTVTFTNSEARQIFCKNFWLHRMVFNIELTCSNNEKVPSSRETLEWQEKGRRIS